MENKQKPFLSRLFDKGTAGTPDSPWYDVLERSTRLLLPFLVRTRFETGGLTLPEGPALFVSNHPTPVDYMQIACLLWPRRIVPIANEYYMRRGLSKKLLSSAGIIPKKMFANDVSMIRKALRTVQGGWSLYLAPEGRLSADGEPYPIHPSSGGFARLLKVPLVILHFSGAYYNKPKWRRDFRRQTVRIEVKDIIPPEELKKMTSREVNARIRAGIAADEAARTYEKSLVWPKGGKALGLQNLIYRCPACGALYAMETAGNALSCRSCSMTLRFDEHYRLEENPAGWEGVADLYRAVRKFEEAERPSLSSKVRVHRFRGETEDKGEGEAFLSPEGFSFAGTAGGEEIRFQYSPVQLKTLPFSCGQEFETYYQGDLYYFYPDTQREQCARWGLLADLYCEACFEEK